MSSLINPNSPGVEGSLGWSKTPYFHKGGSLRTVPKLPEKKETFFFKQLHISWELSDWDTKTESEIEDFCESLIVSLFLSKRSGKKTWGQICPPQNMPGLIGVMLTSFTKPMTSWSSLPPAWAQWRGGTLKASQGVSLSALWPSSRSHENCDEKYFHVWSTVFHGHSHHLYDHDQHWS